MGKSSPASKYAVTQRVCNHLLMRSSETCPLHFGGYDGLLHPSSNAEKPLTSGTPAPAQNDEEGELRFLLLEFTPPTSLPLDNRYAILFPLFRVTSVNGILVDIDSHVLAKQFCSILPVTVVSSERFVCAIFIWEKKG